MFAIEALRNQARQLVMDYNNVYQAAANAVVQLHNFVQAEQAAAAAYQATAASYENMIRRMQAANAAYASNPLGGGAFAGGSSGSGSGSGNGGGSNSGSSSTGGSRSSSNSSNKKKKFVVKTPNFNFGMDLVSGNYTHMATGGYTGSWNSDQGKLAVLHEKELVLNKDDTKNFLKGTYILREISSSLEGSLNSRMNNIGIRSANSTNKEELQQNVHIDATFPNVDSKREIEEALSDLVNLAAQRVLRR